MNIRFKVSSALLVAVLATLPAFAQPSGGPYGPQPQTYELPKDAAHIYYVSPDGKTGASGASLAEPISLESAIAKAVTNAAVILRGGTYRTGGLQLNQGSSLQPYAGEKPVLKGTLVALALYAMRAKTS